MNFKIESNSLNLTNYPIIAKHFESIAAKGWLIDKIIGNGVFIYKKIEPEKLDFSIAPYEIETVFTKKTKKELEEFETVCKNVGWNFVTQHFNLHIYYKEEGAEATPIQTDEEEEFKTIEEIAEKQLKATYLQMAIFILLVWMQTRGVLTDVHWMKDGLLQIVTPTLVIVIISEAINIFRLRRFLNVNRENIEMGDSIEYYNPKTLTGKIVSLMYIILTVLFIFYIFYAGIVLKNKIYLIAVLPAISVLLLAGIYRLFIKPSKKSLNFKKISLIVVMIISALISTWTIFISIDNLLHDKSIEDIEGLKVLSINDFSKEKIEDERSLMKNMSILIPESYEYDSYNYDSGVSTEYSDVLNERLAKNLVQRYITQASSQKLSFISESLELSFKENIYVDWLDDWGLKERDYKELSKLSTREAVKGAKKIIRESNIQEDTENLWNLDEVYFLRDEKQEIVIRQGKEVFYLDGHNLIEGKDFTDPEIIRIVKAKLGL